MEPCEIFQIHNFLWFKNKSQSISDHSVKKNWKSIIFWARSVIFKRNSCSWDTVYMIKAFGISYSLILLDPV